MARFAALRAGTIVLVVALLAVAAFAFGPTVERKVMGKAPPNVTTLRDMTQLAAAFSRDAGSPRLVVIFSPT